MLYKRKYVNIFHGIVINTILVFTACSTSPKVETKTNDKFVKVDVSKLGIENTQNKTEIHTTYNANDTDAKKYQQIKEIKAENKRNDEKEFKSFIREEGRK